MPKDYKSIPLGAKRDKHDPRDFLKARAVGPATLPTRSSLDNPPPIKDQGQRSSCTGHAVAWMWEHLLSSRLGLTSELSPLYLWYYGRASEGNQGSDQGVGMRSAVAALSAKGVCYLDQCGYDYPLEQEPSEAARLVGQALRLPRYERCMSLEDVKYCLAVERQSCVLCVAVTEAWYGPGVASSGIIPEPGDSPLVGYHAVAAAGFDDRFGWLKFANSWGPGWGSSGYGYIPYDCVSDPGFDAWTAAYDSLPPGQPVATA